MASLLEIKIRLIEIADKTTDPNTVKELDDLVEVVQEKII